ncbi:hypothetical protein AAVH_37898, partial [Aphelenchoides avenae]
SQLRLLPGLLQRRPVRSTPVARSRVRHEARFSSSALFLRGVLLRAAGAKAQRPGPSARTGSDLPRGDACALQSPVEARQCEGIQQTGLQLQRIQRA